jgi:DNA repair protein RadC
MLIKNISPSERPREKMLKFGADCLTNSELLAILLNNSGQRNLSVLELAHQLLGDSGSLRKLAQCSIMELTHQKGIGPAKAMILKSAFEIARRFEEECHPLSCKLNSPTQIAKHFMPRFRDAKQEVFILLCLNSKKQLLTQKKISIGGLSAVSLKPRDFFRIALEQQATGIILLHNHPSGDSNPSKEDCKLTAITKTGSETVGISLLDHIIIGDRSYYSFHEAGKI